jgi:hypothetical protein
VLNLPSSFLSRRAFQYRAKKTDPSNTGKSIRTGSNLTLAVNMIRTTTANSAISGNK